MSPDEERIARLVPEFRAILEAELAAGNTVASTWNGWGLDVLLERPFVLTHAVGGAICFLPLDSPHYWKAEYAYDARDQLVGCRF